MKKSPSFVLIILILLLFTLSVYKLVNNLTLSIFDQSFKQIFTQILSARQNPTLTNDFNIIILGLDYRQDALENTQTTDTIIFTNINNAQVSIISLPRDLWDETLKAKINQIYPKSLLTPDKFDFIQQNYSRITGQNIDRTIIFTTDDLRTLIELVGGVNVYLEDGFVDEQYPNPEYINNPTPQTPIYQTVKFSAGWNYINSSNVTEFVRSRKSPENGTDLGRIQRQQLLLNALVEKIKIDPFQINLPRIYQYWQQNISKNLGLTDLFSIIFSQSSHLKNYSLQLYTLQLGENSDLGHIYHPNYLVDGQWVFLPSKGDYRLIQQFIKDSLLTNTIVPK